MNENSAHFTPFNDIYELTGDNERFEELFELVTRYTLQKMEEKMQRGSKERENPKSTIYKSADKKPRKAVKRNADNEIIKAWDILAKLDFFDGQRAGRELWFEKPVDIQDEDIRNFSNDVAFLKDFIDRQNAEIERLKKTAFDKCLDLSVIYKIAKDKAIKDFADDLIARAYLSSNWSNGERTYVVEVEDINTLVKERTGEQE